MGTVSSVDYEGRRIYLSAETVGVPLDTVQVYRDVREMRRTVIEHRGFRPMLVSGGNVQKTVTTFTVPYAQLLFGCYLVPFDTPHSLLVVRDTFSDDGRVGVGCFDRSLVLSNVDIDFSVDPVEVRLVSTGGGGAVPSAVEVAEAVWTHSFTSKLLTVARFLGLR